MIMIVDDDACMAETCSMLLDAHGFEVSVETSAASALSRLRNASHRLVITDNSMPGMSGCDLIDELKSHRATVNIPILMISASARSDIPISARYDSFLRKPFLAEELLQEIHRLISNTRSTVAPESYLKA